MRTPLRLDDVDRDIWRLAVPAFLALVAEPLFLLADAAIIGHLGTTPLAGLGIASTVLTTVVGLCIFLAYGTTAAVSRHLGAGELRQALSLGVDGVWLAVLLGSSVAVLGVALTGPVVDLFSVDADVAAQARTYLRIALLGTVPLLVMLATTGVLRGLQDTRTPLWVAVGGNIANVALNLALVGPLGIAGSALGSVLAQVGMAAVLLVAVVRAAREQGAPLTPDPRGVLAAGRAGVPLIVRTLTLRAAIVATLVAVVRGGGTDDIAAHQLAMTVWTFLAFVLDAIAIAAQALTDRSLGAGDAAGTRSLTRRMVRWGWITGAGTGLLLAAASPVLGVVFTPDADVRGLLAAALLVAALGQPVAGVVFVLDGVLIGAGDGRFLARASVLVLALYAPVVLLLGPGWGLVGVWGVFTAVFMGGRWLTLTLRARGDAWLVTGADPPRPSLSG